MKYFMYLSTEILHINYDILTSFSLLQGLDFADHVYNHFFLLHTLVFVQ